MPRYFFDTYDGGPSVDNEGTDYPDAEAASREVLTTLPELARWQPTDSNDELSYTVKVRDEAGVSIYAATLTVAGRWLDRKPEL